MLRGTLKMCIVGVISITVILSIQCIIDPVESSPKDEPKLFFTQRSSSGFFEWLTLSDKKIGNAGFSIFKDAVVRTYKKDVYIIERDGADNLIKYNPVANSADGVTYQLKIGSGTNPQDIAFYSDTKAFVANSNHPSIVVVDPSIPEIKDTIDISSYTYMKENNLSPNACALTSDGNYLYALLQRRDGLSAGAPSLVLKINMVTNAIEDTMPTVYKNGQTLTVNNGMVYVINLGSYSKIGDGAIEAINLKDKTVKTVIDEVTLGGNPYAMQHKTGSIFYVTVYIAWQNVAVKEIDFATGQILAVVPDIKDAFGGICYDPKDSVLYVGECDSLEMGIKVFKNNIIQGSVIKSSKTLLPSSLAIINE